MRSSFRMLILAPAFVLAACSKDKPADTALSNDLSLAAQSNVAPLDSISAAERANAMNPAPAAAYTAPARVATPAPTRRTTTASTARRRSTSTSSGSSSGRVIVATEPRTETVKNTKRDAAIGAAAGAVIGGATTRSVKGGIIGAAAGAILGGVIGNNVDVQKKRVP